MPTESTDAEKIRRLPWSIATNTTNIVFTQLTFFGSLFVLFLSELGMNKTQTGFFLSILPFSGVVALFIAPTVARFGYKRTFLLFFGARKVVAASLLLTPSVLLRFGSDAVLMYVAGIVLVFAICRSVAETAYYPWSQEFIPNSIRGKYYAVNRISATMSSLLAVTWAGYMIGQSQDLGRFMVLFGMGVLIGLISVSTASFIPGGAPVRERGTDRIPYGRMLTAIQDRSFMLYLAGISLITLTSVPLVSFLPLFMKEQVGLTSGNVVLLQSGTLLGGLLSSYLWGWSADRYGSKTVILSSVYLQVLLPVCWLLMPRHSTSSFYVAMSIAVFEGVARIGWQIASLHLLFVSIVPPEKKMEYMAIYYAWIGIIGGLSQVIGGSVLDYSKAIAGKLLIFTLDQYTVLFLVALTLPAVSIVLLRGIRADILNAR